MSARFDSFRESLELDHFAEWQMRLLFCDNMTLISMSSHPYMNNWDVVRTRQNVHNPEPEASDFGLFSRVLPTSRMRVRVIAPQCEGDCEYRISSLL